jgi:3-hydroxymyristoyl/3-hydroxydecanoyl-(acyl carrier protein) dehydratase
MSGHAIWTVPDNHPALAGHFPGNPILPGAILLQEVAAAIVERHPGLVCRELASAKFLHPVRPGDHVAIDWQPGAGGDIRFTCAIDPDGPCVLQGSLRFGPP